MKTLIVLRHATAEKSGPDGRDVTRRLTAGGRQEASAQGRRLIRSGASPQSALVSAAARAVETAEQVCAEPGLKPRVQVLDRLYNASGHELLEALGDAPEAAGTVLLVAHMPGVAELVYLLLPPGQSPDLNFVPGAYALMTLDIPRWAAIAPASGHLQGMITPEP